MSSYLLAIFVSDLVSTESTLEDGNVKFRLWSTRAAKKQTQFGAELAPKVVRFFNNFFKIDYPLRKLDMVACPDFKNGAMENWGLIIYNDKGRLLYAPESSTPSDKIKIAETIAHEVSHQWFGNLVTLRWWDDMWLNEGFATFMSYVGGAIAGAELRMDDRLAITASHDAKRMDQNPDIQIPMYFKVATVNDMYTALNELTYKKGASILRMTQKLMGSENFQNGLKHYISTYAYGNANHTNLWDSLSQVESETHGWDGGKLNLEEFAKTWTNQNRYPLVVVTESNTPNGEKVYMLSQEKFSLGNPEETSPFNYTWYIPIWYSTVDEGGPSDPKQFIWLTPNDDPVHIGPFKGESLPIINPENEGFFRTLYPKAMYPMLAEMLRKYYSGMDAITKCTLVDDAFNLAEAHRIGYTDALQLLSFLPTETDNFVWLEILKNLENLMERFRFTSANNVTKLYMQRLMRNVYDKYGWKTDSTNDVYEEEIITKVTNLMCFYGGKDCIEKSWNLSKDLMTQCQTEPLSTCNTQPNSFHATQYCSMVKTNDAAFKLLWRKLAVEKAPHTRTAIFQGLACAGRKEQILHVPGNWRIIRFALKIWESSQIDKLENFLEITPSAKKFERSFQQTIKEGRENIAWLSENQREIESWLKANL